MIFHPWLCNNNKHFTHNVNSVLKFSLWVSPFFLSLMPPPWWCMVENINVRLKNFDVRSKSFDVRLENFRRKVGYFRRRVKNFDVRSGTSFDLRRRLLRRRSLRRKVESVRRKVEPVRRKVEFCYKRRAIRARIKRTENDARGADRAAVSVCNVVR